MSQTRLNMMPVEAMLFMFIFRCLIELQGEGKWKTTAYTVHLPGVEKSLSSFEQAFESSPTGRDYEGMGLATFRLCGVSGGEEQLAEALARPSHVPQGAVHFTTPLAHSQACAACDKSGAVVKLRSCTRCKKVWYCGKDCQASDWRRHKKDCKPVAAG